MKEIIVTGGRDYSDWNRVQEVLNLFEIDLIIQGGANGADYLATKYAKFYGRKWKTVAADWDLHGRAAGPIRNKEMLTAYPNAVIVAFPGGAGTADCVRQANALKRIVLTVNK